MTNKEMKKLETNFKNRWVDYLHADYEAKFGDSGYTEDDAQRRLNVVLGYSSAIFDVLSLTYDPDTTQRLIAMWSKEATDALVADKKAHCEDVLADWRRQCDET